MLVEQSLPRLRRVAAVAGGIFGALLVGAIGFLVVTQVLKPPIAALPTKVIGAPEPTPVATPLPVASPEPEKPIEPEKPAEAEKPVAPEKPTEAVKPTEAIATASPGQVDLLAPSHAVNHPTHPPLVREASLTKPPRLPSTRKKARPPRETTVTALEGPPLMVSQPPTPSAPPESDEEAQFTRVLTQARRATQAENYRGASAQYRRALALKPDSLEAKAGLGIALVNSTSSQHGYEEAVRLLEDATRGEGKNAHAWLALGMAYQFTSQKPKAKDAYQRYLTLDPSGPSSGEVRALLKELGD
jgi:tetratricopeptide (TPR) repeat protein